MTEQNNETESMGLLDRLICERAVGHPICEKKRKEGSANSVDKYFGILTSATGAAAGFLDGFDIRVPLAADLSLKVAPTILQSAAEWFVGFATMASLERYGESAWPFAVRGAGLGAGKTTLGYCLGYTAASLIKKHL